MIRYLDDSTKDRHGEGDREIEKREERREKREERREKREERKRKIMRRRKRKGGGEKE